eukprot:4013845-Lingulodinium_polyedra.AAC.1
MPMPVMPGSRPGYSMCVYHSSHPPAVLAACCRLTSHAYAMYCATRGTRMWYSGVRSPSPVAVKSRSV